MTGTASEVAVWLKEESGEENEVGRIMQCSYVKMSKTWTITAINRGSQVQGMVHGRCIQSRRVTSDGPYTRRNKLVRHLEDNKHAG